MKLEHVALAVSDRKEIERFYQNIIGMKVIKSFHLDQALANAIFGIAKNTEVVLLEKDHLQLEIFIQPEIMDHGFDHICISTTQREALVEKANRHSYKVFRLRREYSDLVFISDFSGNIFEVKESKK